MSARPVKRSLTLRGHRTSVSLEAEFWEAFREIARAQNKPLNVLASEIDAARGANAGLASAIRVYVLAQYRRSGADLPDTQDPRSKGPPPAPGQV